MVYDNIPTLVSVVLFLLRVCNCLQTLAKVAVSLLQYSDEYGEEVLEEVSYASLHSIKASDLPIVLHIVVKAIAFEFWSHQLYRQILKNYLAV